MVIKLTEKQIESVKNGHSGTILNPRQKAALEDKIREKIMNDIKEEIIQTLRDMSIDVTDNEADLIAFDFVEDWMHVGDNIQKEWIVDKLRCIRADA